MILKNKIFRRPNSKQSQGGWVLLTLIFMVAVLAISLAAILPSIKQEILRDQEEEMIHRGAQYTRAIRLFYKKGGRYPAKIEDLENTNNIRFLRKRYKDLTVKGDEPGGADFKLLRFGDPNVNLTQPGFNPAAAAAAAQGQGQDLQGGALDRSQRRAEVAAAAAAVQQQRAAQAAADPNQNPDAAATDANGNPAAPNGAAPATPPPNPDGESNPDQASTSKPSGDTAFGGGAIVGVASTNENIASIYGPTHAAIREFNKKRHYNEWQFIYDPQTETGILPNGPWQPLTIGGAGQNQQIGTPAGQLNGTQPGQGNQTLPEPIRDVRQ